MRIIAFVGSPVEHDEKEAVKVAKRLKKEKVNVDIVSFGEDVSIFFLEFHVFENTKFMEDFFQAINATILATFINTINGKDGNSSHLVSIPPGPHLSDALISSPVIQVKLPKLRIPFFEWYHVNIIYRVKMAPAVLDLEDQVSNSVSIQTKIQN